MRPRCLGGLVSVLAVAFPVLAHAQEEDVYFETVRGARDDGCSEKGKYVCYDLLSTHHENYFLSGFNGATQVKFQFSVKYNLWPNETPSTVQFGYTQLNKWNMYSASSPFTETNYNPEAFYTYDFRAHGHAIARVADDAQQSDLVKDTAAAPAPAPDAERDVRCTASFLRGGFEHQSNGLGGVSSRGWNRVYGEARGGCELGPVAYVTGDLTAWLPPFGDSDNPDISKYLGSGDLTVALGLSSDDWWGAAEVAATVRKGWRAAIGVGGLEVDARWRPGYASLSKSWRFIPYFFGQMYTGYGETLLDYNNPETSIRIGFGLSGSVRWKKSN